MRIWLWASTSSGTNHLSTLVLFLGVACSLPIFWMTPETTTVLGTSASTVPLRIELVLRCQKCHCPCWTVTGRRGVCFDCTVFSWPPCPSSRSSQSPENAMHLLLSEVRKCTLGSSSFISSADKTVWLWVIVHRELPTCKTAVLHMHARGYRRYPPYPPPLFPSVKHRAPLQRWAQGALVVAGLFTYKICLCQTDLMKCMLLGIQCDALLKTG